MNLLEIFLLISEVLTLLGKWFYLTCVYWYRALFPGPKKSLNNNVVVITGGGHGLGREMAIICARLGAKVVVWDINKENNENVADEIRQLGHTARAYHCDVTDEKQVAQVAQKVFDDFEKVDILINNAGIASCTSLLNLRADQIRRTMDVNLLSQFWTLQAFLPKMTERKEGHVVAIASVAGLVGSAFLTDYCASKYAVVGLMYSLREELHYSNHDEIKLTTICPVFINTGLFQNIVTRFPNLMPVLDTKTVAQRVIDAIQREEELVMIPRLVEILYRLLKPYPEKVQRMVQRFFECNIQSPK